MDNFVGRIFRLREGELKLVLLLSFLLLSNELTQQMSAIMGITKLLKANGIIGLLIVWGIGAVIILLISVLTSLIIDRFNRIAMLQWVSGLFSVAFLILVILRRLNVTETVLSGLLFLISEQQRVVFPTFLWVLSNDLFSMAQTKRIFPLIDSSGFGGKIIGIGLVLLLTQLSGRRPESYTEGRLTEGVLLFGAAVYLLNFILITWRLRGVQLVERLPRGEGLRDTLIEGWGFVREVLSFRYLAIAILAMWMSKEIVGLRFYEIVNDTFIDLIAKRQFLSGYRLGAAILSFAVQGFITSRLLEKISLRNAFLVLPGIILIGLTAMIISPIVAVNLSNPIIIVLWFGVAAQVIVLVTRLTVGSTSMKSFLSLVPQERKGRVSLFMENYLTASGTLMGVSIAGGIILGARSANFNAPYILYLGVAFVVATIGFASFVKMRAVYDSSMLNWRLKRRSRVSSVIDKLDFGI